MVKGLKTATFKGKVPLTMSQVIIKLNFEVDVALIYVCKAFWREINTPANLPTARTHQRLNYGS